jgi:hypothetical protein
MISVRIGFVNFPDTENSAFSMSNESISHPQTTNQSKKQRDRKSLGKAYKRNFQLEQQFARLSDVGF